MRALLFVCVALAMCGCDQLEGNRYEIIKDQAGRTLRLDKRTGAVSVIEGERIVPVRSAKDVEQERSVTSAELGKAKSYRLVPLPQWGVQATLRMSWQDGRLLYAESLRAKGAESP